MTASHWQTYPGAPAVGTRLCHLDEIPMSGHLSLWRQPGAAHYPVLIVRYGAGFRAFVNACSHQFLPLDHRGDALVSADGTLLRCTCHGAGFRISDGVGIEGHGIGGALDRIPVALDAEQWLVVAGDAPAV